jgi:isocitrate/isopropylmalate dehydrogenase
MRTYKIAAMGGDGIGPEVVEAGVQVLGVCGERDGRFTLDFPDFDWGSDYYRKHGVWSLRALPRSLCAAASFGSSLIARRYSLIASSFLP